ncbi:MAG: hypothetical protein RIC55_28775 [Pirellulaceae bacterium]
MSGARARVVKVGGSLFDHASLADEIRRFLDKTPPAATVLLAGGGELCDVIRRHDRRYGLGEEAAHELCVRLLDVSARVLRELLPEAHFAADWRALEHCVREHVATPLVFSPVQFLAECEPHLPGRRLPRDWTTTTDSIAARLAESLAADLVLLKSASPPAGTLAELAAARYVDRQFPLAAASLPRVTLVNLRNPDLPTSIREIRPSRGC